MTRMLNHETADEAEEPEKLGFETPRLAGL